MAEHNVVDICDGRIEQFCQQSLEEIQDAITLLREELQAMRSDIRSRQRNQDDRLIRMETAIVRRDQNEVPPLVMLTPPSASSTLPLAREAIPIKATPDNISGERVDALYDLLHDVLVPQGTGDHRREVKEEKGQTDSTLADDSGSSDRKSTNSSSYSKPPSRKGRRSSPKEKPRLKTKKTKQRCH